MSKKIIIAYKTGIETTYGEGIEFVALITLFHSLLDPDIPKTDNSADLEEMQNILEHVNKYNISSITFSQFRKIHFIEHTGDDNRVKGFEVKIEELNPDFESVLKSMDKNTKVEIFGGTLGELKELADSLPPPVREFLKKIEEKNRQFNKDPRTTHETTETTH